MAEPGQHSLSALARRRPKPLVLIAAATTAVLMSLAALHWGVASSLRENSLAAAEGMTLRRGTLLVEQADRAIQSVDFVLLGLIEHIVRAGVTSSDSYAEKMGTFDVHLLLREKMDHVPQLDAITMVNADGALINFSRYWPIPDVNIADRDYFKSLRNDPSRHSFISAPVRNRGDGTWNIYLARRISGTDGEFIGLVLGAMTVSYFEDVYRSVMTGGGTGIGLFRFDGVPLARVPEGATADTALPVRVPASDEVMREIGADGVERIKVVQWLRSHPLFVLSSQTETSAFATWRRLSDLWLAAAIVGGVLVVAVALAVALWHLTRERASEAERARARAEAELLRQQERHAEAANNAKSAFLATMSHEIRTPMHALLGLASTLLESRLEPDQRAAVAAMQESGDTLLRLLNDILDFSKLEAGKFTFESLPFSPHALTDTILSIICPRAQAKGLAIRFAQSEDVPAALQGDPGRIRQVLLNLLSNAVKFTDRGQVSLSLRCLERREQSALIEWTVADTGVGIPADRLPTLFNDFVQADGSISRRFGGTGLGLAICKRIADQMGGVISAASEAGRGATFRFRVPLLLASELPSKLQENPNVAADLHALVNALGRPLRVLIAEDNPTNQMVAAKMLQEFNVRIDIASDGCEAVDAAARSPFDVILMDVSMPEMDGLQAARAIRTQAGCCARVPIIAMTANAFGEDVAACRAVGMTGFVPKPTSKRVLVEAFVQVLSGDVVTGGRRAAPMPAADVASEPVFDAAAYAELCDAIGTDGAEQTLAVFITESRARLARLQALSPDLDHGTIRDEAHTLKGAAGCLGLRLLQALARGLEVAARRPVARADYDVVLTAIDDAFARSLGALSVARATRAGAEVDVADAV